MEKASLQRVKTMSKTFSLRLLERKISRKESADRLLAGKIEEFAASRARALDRAFVWMDENTKRFLELDEFLREKQRLLVSTVRRSVESAMAALKADGGFLGGEIEAEGNLVLEDPYDESMILQGLSEPIFSAMVSRANRWTYSISCSSYRSAEGDIAEQEKAQSGAYSFPEGRGDRLRVCYALYALYGSRVFALQDLLALDRALFGCKITMENFF